MPEQPDKLTFEASAYLQTLIGRELFRSRELAVVELVKNAYDSGARNVTIRISSTTGKRPASFEITDDGSGMDLAEIKRLSWFRLQRKKQRRNRPGSQNAHRRKGYRPLRKRPPRRLHSKSETKTAAETEGTVVPINWNLFNTRKKRFNQIEVPYYRRPLSFLRKKNEAGRAAHDRSAEGAMGQGEHRRTPAFPRATPRPLRSAKALPDPP